ncbi:MULTISPECIES: potassium channel family protein [Bacillaceae]|uniref:potassium channel family protein n=1 Tax=Bacillaceae TaxID=186817 RepID=UPI001BDF1E78|nr:MULTISPECIES: potassium channel family protein [Bacillaceae]MDX8362332.1 ion channel [Cytobacillus sp. IB215316]
MVSFIVLLTFFCIIMSVRTIWSLKRKAHQLVSFENLFALVTIYITVLVGFGLIYTILEENGYSILKEDGQHIIGDFLTKLQTSMYFSAITLLSVGYGDITPVGGGRWIAIAEALLGYTIPAAFVVKTVIQVDKKES